MAWHRTTDEASDRTRVRRGRVIAFVGSEATGKSTLLNEIEAWLRRDFRVRRIHAGKPPSTPLTFVPHVLLPAFRRLFPEQRLTRVEARHRLPVAPDDDLPLLFALRSVMLAYERRALLARAFARSWDGEVALSDRYPSARSGAPDSPQLGGLLTASGAGLRRSLAALEARLYRDIPPPDLVVHLTAPLDVTLARNAARDKTEPEAYVRLRHSMSANLEFVGVVVRHVATDRPLDAVLGDVKKAIGEAL